MSRRSEIYEIAFDGLKIPAIGDARVQVLRRVWQDTYHEMLTPG
jgi:hypothetical protein